MACQNISVDRYVKAKSGNLGVSVDMQWLQRVNVNLPISSRLSMFLIFLFLLDFVFVLDKSVLIKENRCND